MTKRFTSVAEVVNEYIDDGAFRKQFEKEINDKRVAKTLFTIRNRAGKTQDEMAEILGCSGNTISRLENSSSDEYTVSDLSLIFAFLEENAAFRYDVFGALV